MSDMLEEGDQKKRMNRIKGFPWIGIFLDQVTIANWYQGEDK